MVVQVTAGVEVMEGNQQRVEANVLLLGAHSVGKSALTVRFLTRRFIGEYGDIESVYSRVEKIDGQEVCFNIWDCQHTQSVYSRVEKIDGQEVCFNIWDCQHTQSVYSRVEKIDGQEVCFNIWDCQHTQSPSLSDKRLQWADGVVLVYSICDRRSFDVVCQQLQLIGCGRKPWAGPVVIVGNKRDLRRHRSVSGEEGRLLALSHGCSFFEVSAAETYHGVLLVFHRLADLVREGRALRKGSAGVRGIVRSVSAVFGKKRAE